jgi:hypothetical protein
MVNKRFGRLTVIEQIGRLRGYKYWLETTKIIIMKLWSLNKEFNIEIYYPYTFNFPTLRIEDKKGNLLMSASLWDKSLKEQMESLKEKFPDSEFLNRLFKQQGI